MVSDVQEQLILEEQERNSDLRSLTEARAAIELFIETLEKEL